MNDGGAGEGLPKNPIARLLFAKTILGYLPSNPTSTSENRFQLCREIALLME